MKKDIEYDDLSDLFEYGKIDEKEAVMICNEIIFNSLSEKDSNVLEAMFHAVFTCANTMNIARKLRLDILEKHINSYPEMVLDYIITIMAYTGEEKYIEFIEEIGKKHNSINIRSSAAEALTELENTISWNRKKRNLTMKGSQ